MRVRELAAELGVDARRLVGEINAAELGFRVDNPMSQLTPAEVSRVKRARGIADHPLLGTWRLVGITHGDHEVMTGKTHLVVRADAMWEVWPDQVRYVGDPDPWRSYELDWLESDDGRLVVDGARFETHYIVRLVGEELCLRAGGVAGQPPKSFADEHGTLTTYVREMDPEVLESLREPPAPLARVSVTHATLGELTYDENLNWWTAKTTWDGGEIAFRVDGGPASVAADFDRGAQILAALDPRSIKLAAADELLDTHNDGWCDEGEEVDAETFITRMQVESVNVDADGGVVVYFDDGDLFWGHAIYVSLNEGLQVSGSGIAG